MSSILVTYATKYGSTAEVAERIGETLRQRGLAVDVAPARKVADVSPYSAVVVGSPLYIGKMLKDANAFLERHRVALEKMPVAMFVLGPLSASDDMAEVREQLDSALEKIGWLKPIATELFVGKLDPATLRGLDKLLTKLKASPLYGAPAQDGRDWDAIERWTSSLQL